MNVFPVKLNWNNMCSEKHYTNKHKWNIFIFSHLQCPKSMYKYLDYIAEWPWSLSLSLYLGSLCFITQSSLALWAWGRLRWWRGVCFPQTCSSSSCRLCSPHTLWRWVWGEPLSHIIFLTITSNIFILISLRRVRRKQVRSYFIKTPAMRCIYVQIVHIYFPLCISIFNRIKALFIICINKSIGFCGWSSHTTPLKFMAPPLILMQKMID